MSDTKQCGRCGEVRPVSQFYKRSDRSGYRSTCRPCHNRRSSRNRKLQRQREPEHMKRLSREQNYRRSYGLSAEEREDYLQHVCAICGEPSEVIDHCHASGDVRAALCHHCNTGLGSFKDDPARLRAAALYLERHAATDGSSTACPGDNLYPIVEELRAELSA